MNNKFGNRICGMVVVLNLLALANAAWAQSAREGMGAIVYEAVGVSGVTFRTWAPNASTVSVAGEFNGWNSSANPLVRETVTGGLWSADVPGARAGQPYKFVIDGLWRRDAHARLLEPDGTRNSLVFGRTNFNWSGDQARLPYNKDTVIYEIHVGTFCDTNPADTQVGRYLDVTNRLAYLADLGVNAVELLPVSEFPTERSWGYNLTYPFAVETTYGAPDELKSLVKTCHAAGFSALLDVVFNHWGDDDHADWSLWRYDGWYTGTNGGVFFYTNNPYFMSPWGPRPNYDRPEVRQYILDNLRMWKDEYHFDGFRWDTPKHIIYTDWTLSTPIPRGQTLLLEARALLDVQYPGTLNIAEDNKELSLFDAYWDNTFHDKMKNVMEQGDDSQRNMMTLMSAISGMPRRIIYTESHDTAGDLNGGKRFPLNMPWSADNGYYSRKRSMLAAMFVFTSPGIPMILQGQEMMETNQFSDALSLNWAGTNNFPGVVRFYRDAIRLRRNLAGTAAGLQEDGLEILQVNHTDKVIVFRRGREQRSPDDVVVIANLSNTARTDYPVVFPAPGRWRCLLNSDSTNYCADFGDVGTSEVWADGVAATGSVSLGRYSALVLSRQSGARLALGSVGVDDTLWGNHNGYVDQGEGVLTAIVFSNAGLSAASDVSLTLSTTNPWTRIMVATSAYPSISAGGVAANLTPLHYRVATNVPCRTYVDFDLACRYDGVTWTNRLRQRVGHPSSFTFGKSKYFYADDVPVAIPDPGKASCSITVDEPDFHVIREVTCLIRIDHSYVGDLEIELEHPDGTRALVCRNQGGAGQNFGTGTDCLSWTGTMYTHFNRYATQHISEAAAPFDSGESYRPIESFEEKFAAKDINGVWRLWVTDDYAGNTGTVVCWSLKLLYYDPAGTTCDCVRSNHPPAPSNLVRTVDARTSSNFLMQATDPDQDIVRYRLAGQPLAGEVILTDSNTGAYAYRPAHAFHGTDSFYYLADDSFLTSTYARVDLTVQPDPDTDHDGLPDWWETLYFGSPTNADPIADGDSDRMNNLREYGALTHPVQSNSFLWMRILPLSGGTQLSWPSVGGVRYELQQASTMTGQGLVFSNIAWQAGGNMDHHAYGVPGTNRYSPPPAGDPSGAARLYRLRVPGAD